MTFDRELRTAHRARQLMASAVGAMLLLLALCLPALGAPPGPTKLLSPDVSPRSADTATAVTFSVLYRNAHDLPPDYVRVAVGGTTYAMTGAGTDWKVGVLFAVATKLPAGTYDVLFEAHDTEKFVDEVAAGSVSIAQAPAPAPTPRPDPTPTPTPTPTSGGTSGSGSSGGTSGSGATGGTGGSGGDSTAGDAASGSDGAGGSGGDSTTGDGVEPNWTGPGIEGPNHLAATTHAGQASITGDSGLPNGGGTSAGGGSGGQADGASGSPSEGGGIDADGGAGGTVSAGSAVGGSYGPAGGAGDWLQASFDGGLAVLGLSGPGHMPTLPAVVTPTLLVTTWMAFMLFNKRRRDGEPPAPDGVLQAAAATGVGMGPVFAPNAVAPDPEALMPRWRRPSLLEARKTDPIRSPAPARPRLAFVDGAAVADTEAERRTIRYAVIPLLDRPDEILAARIGELVEGDEVQVQQRSGAYCYVLCPDGREGWVHRTTLGDVVVPEHHLGGRVTDDPEPDAENALAALLAARGLR